MTLDRYLENRRIWEAAMVLGITLVSFLANLGLGIIEYGRIDADYSMREPLILEGTSHVALLLLIPLVIWFDRGITRRIATGYGRVAAHALLSVVFSLAHVTLMYWSRVILFPMVAGRSYVWSNWPGDFAYEYLKDFRTYLLIIGLVYLYRFVLRRWQGEAGFLAEETADQPGAVSDRFLVKKLGREFLVRINEIDWIESCGNYVNLHVGDRVYPLRETMTRIAARLGPLGFQRVHRSAIVNLDCVAEIIAFDTGDGEAKLHTGATVPVSRRFRKDLRNRLA